MNWLKRLYLRWRYPDVCWKHMLKRPSRGLLRCPRCQDEFIDRCYADRERRRDRDLERDAHLRTLGVRV